MRFFDSSAREHFFINLGHALGAPLPCLSSRVGVRGFAHLESFLRVQREASNARCERRNCLARASDRDLNPSFRWNESSNTLVIQSQDWQLVGHSFQNLRAKRISEACEDKSVCTPIESGHFIPRDAAEEHDPFVEAQASRVTFPLPSHFPVTDNEESRVDVLRFSQGLKCQGQALPW
jgi:hypothetical protein